MRPRRVRLGCCLVDRADRLRRLASMRPRRVRLGCRAALQADHVADHGFNEAEARAPRMPRRTASGFAGSRSFNEAEARAPRMPHTLAGFGVTVPALQ